MNGNPFSTISTLGTALASIKTNPASTTTQVRSIWLHNTNSTAEQVEIDFVPNASGALGTPAASNRIVNVSIPANESLEVSFAFPIHLGATNDAIFAKTTTAAKVNALVSGVTNV